MDYAWKITKVNGRPVGQPEAEKRVGPGAVAKAATKRQTTIERFVAERRELVARRARGEELPARDVETRGGVGLMVDFGGSAPRRVGGDAAAIEPSATRVDYGDASDRARERELQRRLNSATDYPAGNGVRPLFPR
jgi:hypothetical protein